MSPHVFAILAATALPSTRSSPPVLLGSDSADSGSSPPARHLPLAQCPGNLNLGGFGMTSIVVTGWAAPDEFGFAGLQVSSAGDELVPELGSRAYFAQSCQPGVYDHNQYLALNLLGKRMRYTTDMYDLGCGCNAAFYLTSMHQNSNPSGCSDYYCDANSVCGESCAEIDIQEGNMFSWHSTLHGKLDNGGFGKGVGGGGADWKGPRDWSTAEYGPGASCIDTSKPFQVEVGFPTGADCQLDGMDITLSQVARSDCELKLSIDSYAEMSELSNALAAGMTPVVSYWNSADMLWMDGEGADGKGPCPTDRPADCSKRTKFSNFSVAAIPGTMCKAKLTNQQPAKDAPAKEGAMTTTTLLVAEGTAISGIGGFVLGFLAGVLAVSIVFVVLCCIRCRQSEQTQRTVQLDSMPSSHSLVSLASVAEEQELGQQQT